MGVDAVDGMVGVDIVGVVGEVIVGVGGDAAVGAIGARPSRPLFVVGLVVVISFNAKSFYNSSPLPSFVSLA